MKPYNCVINNVITGLIKSLTLDIFCYINLVNTRNKLGLKTFGIKKILLYSILFRDLTSLRLCRPSHERRQILPQPPSSACSSLSFLRPAHRRGLSRPTKTSPWSVLFAWWLSQLLDSTDSIVLAWPPTNRSIPFLPSNNHLEQHSRKYNKWLFLHCCVF